MKSQLKHKKVTELSKEEVKLIDGGGPGFRWLGEIFGNFANVYESWAFTPEGKAVQQALRDFQ